jgi:hypothetical protein
MSGPLGTSGGGAAGVTSVTAGNGITVTGTTTPTIAASIAAGTGVSIAGTTTLTVNNTGVTSLAGTGISVSAATGSVTVTPTYAAPTALTIGGTVVTGAAASVANSAHVHAMPGSATAGASAVGDTAATGSASTVALSDHRHSREAFGTPIVVNGQSTALATGSLTTLARADHVHTMSNVPVLLASTTVSSAVSSVTFSSIPQTYSHLWLLSRGRSSSVVVVDYMVCVFNGDVIWSNSNYVANQATNSYANIAPIHGTTNVFASRAGMSVTYIFGYSGSDYKYIQSAGQYMNGTTGYPNTGGFYTGEVYMSTTAITSMQFISTNGGNFLTGTTFRLYGMP